MKWIITRFLSYVSYQITSYQKINFGVFFLRTAVIISTYNSPTWLEKVLWGYERQTDRNFEIIIADDGSGKETKELIDSFRGNSDLKISHVWHEDTGFRKTEILNKAIVSTDCEYLIFTDGDCIPRWDLIETHKNKSKKGHYLSAAYYKLSMPMSILIDKSDIQSRRAFDYKWLVENGQPKSLKSLKLTCKFGTIFNFLTPARATWNGANSSAFREDIIAVNGFDERMQYGGEDVELGERLINKGFKSVQMRYSTICLHLDHDRGYAKSEMWKKNKAIRKEVSTNKLDWTQFGIIKN